MFLQNGLRKPEPEGSSLKQQQTKDSRSQEECSRALHILDSAPAPGWTAHVTKEGRLYYCNHITRTAGWLPPADVWKTETETLPYGWERAVDDTGRSYYINHVNKTTTYETPIYRVTENLPKPKPRFVTLERSASLGFGFVAGSEKPVIVRFVTEGGPSVDKLLPGDQILTVNGEDVKLAPREHVISLVRSCTHSVTLEVCQPTEQQGVRKSTLLSATKRARLKCKPSRVRFAESVCVNGAPLFPPSAFSLGDICVPQMANVLKVFLENGQTKSFKYDTWTTVQDVINSLQAKLCIKASEYFSLVVEHIKSLKRNKLTLLDPQDSIARIASQPGAHKLRCLFRVTFVPITAASLAQKDLNGLDYLFNQCCNDVIQERFSPELQYDTALRLAALHMYHHALANNMQANKLTVKIVEKEFGLERFIPASVLDNLKPKEIRKILGHFLKLHSNMTGSGKQLTSLQVKLHYLDITSQLPSYGAKCFSAGPKGDTMEKVILVSPKFGISQITGHRNSVFQPVPLANIEDMRKIEVRTNDEVTRLVFITLKSDKILEITLDEKDAVELVLILRGYYRLITEQELPVDQDKVEINEDLAPPYVSQHKVMPEKWSYLEQGGIKTASFALQPTYQNINKKTNGLYNTVGRHSKQSLLVKYDLDGNMNSSMANRNTRFAGNIDFGCVARDTDFTNILSNQLEGLYPFEKREEDSNADPQHTNRLTYSSEWQETSVDFDSDADEEAGKLKHSDSLTLLNKIHEKEFGHKESELLKQLQSESDNDSLYTPHASPKLTKDDTALDMQKNMSFGLRSPNTLDNHNREFQEYLQRICDEENRTESSVLNSINEMFVFDPDIIDLTSLPPPITPDELDSALPGPLNVPPGPFADSTERLNVLDMNENQDLEEFLASVSVPPPVQKVTPAMELTPEEIMAYIIPPPPDIEKPNGADEVFKTESGAALVKNKSVLHDVLYQKKEKSPVATNGGEPLKPLPRRSMDDKPPERPPKEFIKARRDSSPWSPPKELLQHADLPAPQLPPRSQSNEKPNKPQLPPKKPQLPLLSSLNDPVPKDADGKIMKNSHNVQEERTLKECSMAVSTPVPSQIGKPPLAIYKDPAENDKDPRNPSSHNKQSENLPDRSPNVEELLSKTELALKELLTRLKQASVKCLGRIVNGDTSLLEKEMQRTKEELTAQSLQLVSSSKLLVIAMSDAFLPDLFENLAVCLTILRRLTELCQDLVVYTTNAPLQSRNLILNVYDLVENFRVFVTSPIDRSSSKAVEEHLALHAETLANILSTLLRNLKGFPT
ncbi:FERM and PDZ domain-containing protein 4 [Anthonomus grandis grandis]|uniref:FERM and PDZ domain-containing protein 4 n=1 Tax=Anthonomus grandis grandis TaxID=2921223 RepID=UPI0021665BD2|nr:FERM and PDZ domain-containing protein 4 [Anthonomus grandis grandis]